MRKTWNLAWFTISECNGSVFGFLCSLYTKWRTYATTQNTFRKSLNLSTAMSLWSGSLTTVKTWTFVLLSTGYLSFDAVSGYEDSSSWSHCGPVHQTFDCARCEALQPLDAKFAGFFDDGTCFHLDLCKKSWILATRLATRVDQVLASWAIHCTTVVESVQAWRVHSGWTTWRILVVLEASSTATSAPRSSSIGNETVFTGASGVFDDKIDIVTWRNWQIAGE